jgi:hypothetical protein
MVMRNADTPDVNAAAKQRLRDLKPLIRAELAKQWIQETGLIPRYLMAAHRAWKGLPPETQDLTDLALDRVQAWLTLLEKQKPGMEEPPSVGPVWRQRHAGGQTEVALCRGD